jgi:glycosyltransferase involved in cell wall biosynthesis
MATVDVIIPVFNAARYLPIALESVYGQTFSDWHIVLVDDGSTDNTTEVIAPYLARFGSRITYIRRTNQGPSAARNAAIRASTSEFIALLDADDAWLPCRLLESMTIMSKHPQAGLAYGLVTYMDSEGNLGSTWEGNRNYAEGSIAPQIYMRKVELPCPTITFRRRCIEEAGLFDEAMRATEDRDLWLRIAFRSEVAFIPKVIAYYRVSPTSASANMQKMFEGQLQFLRKHYGAKGCGLRARQIARATVYKQRAEALKRHDKSGAALLTALRAAAIYPFDLDNIRSAASILLHSSYLKR